MTDPERMSDWLDRNVGDLLCVTPATGENWHLRDTEQFKAILAALDALPGLRADNAYLTDKWREADMEWGKAVYQTKRLEAELETARPLLEAAKRYPESVDSYPNQIAHAWLSQEGHAILVAAIAYRQEKEGK